MDEDTRAIEREILVEREELSGNLRELESHARQFTDWRTHYRRHTGAALAVTFGAGVLLGLMVPARVASSARFVDSREHWEPGWEPEESPRRRRSTGQMGRTAIRGLKNLTQTSRAGQQLADTAAGIFSALIGVASQKAIEVVSQLVPGFRDEFQSRHAGGMNTPRYGDSRF